MGANAVTADEAAGFEPGRRSPRRRRYGRYIAVGVGLLLLVALLGGVKAAQIGSLISFGKRAQAAGPPPETVNTFVAQQQSWDQTLSSVGSVAAARGVSISNDTPGIVYRIDFESGATVREGQMLVELDTRVERAQLASARARQELASANLARTRALVESKSLPQSQLDNDKAQFDGATADANALEAQIERKTVRAPFSGKLGIRLINVGQYLGPGTPITVIESSDATYVDFDLPQEDLSLVSVGMPVRFSVRSQSESRSSEGAVYAIDPEVDPSTRNIKVRATVPAKDSWLQPGMFVDVAVVEPHQEGVVAVPSTAVVHASYGDSVFVVEDDPAGKIVRQQFVRVGPVRGDFVAIVEGVTAGQVVVSGGAFKLRNRMRVVVNNAVAPQPQLAPNPPNR